MEIMSSIGKIAIFLFLLFNANLTHAASEKIEFHFFGSGTCGECLQIKEGMLKPLLSKYPDDLDIHFYDTDKDSVLSILIKMENKYKTKSDAAQMLFMPDTFLAGFEAIMHDGRSMIIDRIKNKDKYITRIAVNSDTTVLNQFLKDKALDWAFFAGTLVAGLADGINPCAIATMIFMISFLATRKKGKKEIFVIGSAYTATVFITYFAMGLGLKSVLEQLKHFYIISQTIRWGAFSLALVVAVFSFRDAIVFRKTHDTENIKLQLPKVIKLRIHKIISGNLSRSSLLIGSIITGFLVTLLEAICTGQMYVPYIVAMTQRESLRLAGYLYLAFYNFLFVLPLIIVMFLAFYGLKWNELAKKTQKNMVVLKVVLGVVMTALAVYLGLGSFI
jgi:hypothetical protein